MSKKIAAFAVLGAFVGLLGVSSAKPSCPIASVPARAALIVHPDYPEGAAEEYSGEADITVTLSPTGAVQNVTIYKSSGNKSFDRLSLEAARQSVYTPEYTGCYAVGGTYLFRSIFGGAQ
jgi:TonB family protein